jgi:hypothetical protein
MRGRSEGVERERMKVRSKFSIGTMSGAGRLKREAGTDCDDWA